MPVPRKKRLALAGAGLLAVVLGAGITAAGLASGSSNSGAAPTGTSSTTSVTTDVGTTTTVAATTSTTVAPSTTTVAATTTVAPTTTTTVAAPAPVLTAEDIAFLTVSTTDYVCANRAQTQFGPSAVHIAATGVTEVQYMVGIQNTLPIGTPGARLWSDAMSVPYKATDPVGVRVEAQAYLCVDPGVAYALGHLLANNVIGGVKLADINPWLQPMVGDVSVVNNHIADTLKIGVNDSSSMVEKAAKVQANLDFQVYAARLGTLLDRMDATGIQAESSSLYYLCAASCGVTGGALNQVAIGTNPPDTRPVAVFQFTSKVSSVCVVRIGLNVGDQRPELLVCPPVQQLQAASVPETGPPRSTPPGTEAPPNNPGTSPPGSEAPPNSTSTTEAPPPPPPDTEAPPPSSTPGKAPGATVVTQAPAPTVAPTTPPADNTPPGGGGSGVGAPAPSEPPTTPTTAAHMADPPTTATTQPAGGGWDSGGGH